MAETERKYGASPNVIFRATSGGHLAQRWDHPNAPSLLNESAWLIFTAVRARGTATPEEVRDAAAVAGGVSVEVIGDVTAVLDELVQRGLLDVVS